MNLDDVQTRLTTMQHRFLQQLQQYLDTPLHVFGSIARFDFFEGYSDIDLAIITDQPKEMVTKLIAYLQCPVEAAQHIVQQFAPHQRCVRAYRVPFISEHVKFDICIYSKTDQDIVLYNIQHNNHLPFWVVCLITCLKWCYYHVQCISKETFLNCKKIIMFCELYGIAYITHPYHSTTIQLQ